MASDFRLFSARRKKKRLPLTYSTFAADCPTTAFSKIHLAQDIWIGNTAYLMPPRLLRPHLVHPKRPLVRDTAYNPSGAVVAMDLETQQQRFWMAGFDCNRIELYDRHANLRDHVNGTRRREQITAKWARNHAFPLGYIPSNAEIEEAVNYLHQTQIEPRAVLLTQLPFCDSETSSSRVRQQLQHRSRLLCCKFLPGESGGLITSHTDGSIAVWDIEHSLSSNVAEMPSPPLFRMSMLPSTSAKKRARAIMAPPPAMTGYFVASSHYRSAAVPRPSTTPTGHESLLVFCGHPQETEENGVSLADLRIAEPVMRLRAPRHPAYATSQSLPTVASWNPYFPYCIVYGTTKGEIFQCDLRQLHMPLKCFTQSQVDRGYIADPLTNQRRHNLCRAFSTLFSDQRTESFADNEENERQRNENIRQELEVEEEPATLPLAGSPHFPLQSPSFIPTALGVIREIQFVLNGHYLLSLSDSAQKKAWSPPIIKLWNANTGYVCPVTYTSVLKEDAESTLSPTSLETRTDYSEPSFDVFVSSCTCAPQRYTPSSHASSSVLQSRAPVRTSWARLRLLQSEVVRISSEYARVAASPCEYERHILCSGLGSGCIMSPSLSCSNASLYFHDIATGQLLHGVKSGSVVQHTTHFIVEAAPWKDPMESRNGVPLLVSGGCSGNLLAWRGDHASYLSATD